MGNLNSCTFIGRIGKDPEFRTTQSGTDMVNFSIAVSDKFKDKSGNQQEKTEWINCVYFGKVAGIIQKYCHKGSQIYVSGKMQTREWIDKDNNKRWSTEIIGQNVQFLDSPQQNQQQGGYQKPPQQSAGQNWNPGNQNQNNNNMSDDLIESEIPF